MSCDDDCHVMLDQTPESTANKVKIVYSNSWCDFREFWKDSDLGVNVKRISDWIPLVAGQHYYLEAAAVEGTGGDHFSVGVEIEQTAITDHYHSMREVQEIGINITTNFEKTRVTVENPDSGEYFLAFQGANLQYNNSKKIQADGSASHFRS